VTKVLIIEDDNVIADGMARHLSAGGFDPIEIEELRIDPREVQAYVDGKSAALTPTEFKLLYTLALDRGRVVTRDELLQKVWGRRETHRDRTVDVFVRRLRQKIDKAASTRLVHPDALRRRLQARARTEVARSRASRSSSQVE